MKTLTLNTELYHAKCDECDTPMNEGYCLFGGEHYFCSDKCLFEKVPIEEWNVLSRDEDSDSYWTEWTNEDANYKLVNGELIEL